MHSDRNTKQSMSHINLATASCPITADVRLNGQQIRSAMFQAKAAGVSVIHFSEGALSGYVKSEVLAWHEVDWNVISAELTWPSHFDFGLY
jgi:predicted amidohydrolase